MLNLGFGISISTTADRKNANSYRCRIFDKDFGSFVIDNLNYKDIGNTCMKLKNYISSGKEEFTLIIDDAITVKVIRKGIIKFVVSVTKDGGTVYYSATRQSLNDIVDRGVAMSKTVQANIIKARNAEGIYF